MLLVHCCTRDHALTGQISNHNVLALVSTINLQVQQETADRSKPSTLKWDILKQDILVCTPNRNSSRASFIQHCRSNVHYMYQRK